MILCLICALRAHVNEKPYLGEPEANIVQHNMAKHPNPRVAMMERRELEAFIEMRRVAERQSAR